MKTLNNLLFILVLGALFMFSCDSHKVEEPDIDKEVIKDNIFTSKVVSDLFFDVNNATTKEKSESNDDCFEIKHEMSENLKSWKLSLVYNNCEINGVVKNGEVTVEFTNSWKEGSFAKLKFNNFSVNGYSINGTMDISYEKDSVFKVNADIELTYADGSKTSWKGTKTIKMLENGTCEINGQAEGKARNGKSFTKKEINLIYDFVCPWYVGGKIKIVFEETETYDIEFNKKCGEFTYSYKGINTKQSF